jgi:L-aspartate oxidase
MPMMPETQALSSPVTWWDDRSFADVVIVGAGIAGLSFALRLPDTLRITVVTKSELGESNTRYAQGGMAAAVGPDDTPDLHLADTLDAGAGLTDLDATEGLVERGPSAVRWLLKQGARFDIHGHTLELGQEAAHSRRRILHAGGDATGAEIERALVRRLRMRMNARVIEYGLAVDIVKDEAGRAAGVTVLRDDNALEFVMSGTTVLANGGAGQLWAVTSNPPDATADGVGMALRAGVTVADLEFDQFHPTVLNVPGVPPFLISEAVRGEGAWLVNSAGERFMLQIDERAELAPRNVVAATIQRQLTTIPNNDVYLDLRHLDPALVAERFPTISAHLAEVGISLSRDRIPVAPASHYFMGGIVAGTRGETSLPGLLAIGEVACTGVHGANRLASNSLLEGLVFGINAADRLADTGFPVPGEVPQGDKPEPVDMMAPAGGQAEIRQTMSAYVGVVRDRSGLERAINHLTGIDTSEPPIDRDSLILRNMREVALQIAISAQHREESRGGHIRADFPETDPALDGRHQVVRVADGNVTRCLGPLHGEAHQPTT